MALICEGWHYYAKMSLVGIYFKSLPQYEYERVYDVIFANILKGCLRWVETVQPVMFS